MDDNKKNSLKNQSSDQNVSPLVVEEVAPEVSSPEDQIKTSSDQVEVASLNSNFEEKPIWIYFLGGILIGIFFISFFFIWQFFANLRSKPKEIILTWWGLWEPAEVVKPVIDEYQSKFKNIKIKYEKLDPTNYREKLIVRSRNKEGPDIFRFHNTWSPQLREILSPAPSNIINLSEFEKIFYPIHKNDLTHKGKVFGIPLMIDCLVLVYNEDLFNKAGITREPKTWEDIINIVPELTVKDQQGKIITSGLAIGTTNNLEHFSDIFGLLLIQNGGDLSNLNSDEAVEALRIFRRFAEPPNNFWDEAMPNSLNAFIQEKLAMMIVPSWQLLSVISLNPEIKIKVVPVPSVPGTNPISLATYWAEGVNRYSPYQIEAWRFLRFLTEKETLAKMFETASKIRAFGEPYPRVDMANLIAQNHYLGAVVKQASSLVTLPLSSRTFDNGLNDEIIKYLEDAINQVAQGVDYKDALSTASRGINQVFQKYQTQ